VNSAMNGFGLKSLSAVSETLRRHSTPEMQECHRRSVFDTAT
jgi:hypothetical protein